MGMYDEVYVDERVIKALNLRCPNCLAYPDKYFKFQTKDFNSYSEQYYLTYRVNNKPDIVLGHLHEPDDKKFWVEYTNEEILERNSGRERWPSFLIEKGDGWYTREAYLPENRVYDLMGELPHQWVKIYSYINCNCDKDTWLEYKLKFTDGVVKDIVRV